MLGPSVLLSDGGFGPDVVTVYPVTYGRDRERRSVRQLGPGVEYQAIVMGSQGSAIDASGTEFSVTVYTVVLYSRPDPGVRKDYPVGWRGLALVAQGDSCRDEGDGWIFQCLEYGPDPDGTGPPRGAP